MIHELESLVGNLVVALSRKELNAYPLLHVYRNHMSLVIDPTDQLHEMFNNLDLDNEELRDLLKCSGAEVVTLHDKLIGLRLNEFSPTEPTAIYWLSKKDGCKGLDMSEFYDTVDNFIEAIPEAERPGQRVMLGGCGKLIDWRIVQRHIINNPRELVLGCLNHPQRFFAPSPSLYVRMRDAKETHVLPSLDYLAQSDVESEEPIWFTVSKPVRSTITL